MARAPINGQTLRWARTASHLDQGALAKAAGVTAERIAEFEAGTAAPTFRQLTLMATKLDRPWGFFFAAAPSVSDVPEAADFRGRDEPELSADIAREMRRAEQHREAMLDLTAPPDRAVGLDLISHESAAARARQLRQRFGLTEHFIPPESQQNQVFNFWRGLLEGYGFLIFQATKIDLDAFRGLSVHHDVLPIIVLNGADAASGKVFTLFHEVAHLVNRKSGLCLLDDAVLEEEVANRFAANFLMPETLIRQHLIATSDPVELAAHVASTLKVSSLAAGVRLRTLELISEEDLRSIRQESAETWRLAREAQKTSDGFVPPWRLRYRDLGANYIGAVARALEDRRIDAMDATYLLNARWPMVEQLFQEYYRTGGEA